MTYLIEDDYENYYSLTLDVLALAIIMPSYSQRFRAKPRLDSWVAPNVSFYASDNYTGKDTALPDITTWALGNIILSPKAYLAFRDIMAPSGEFLPLLIDGETYYMFNTLFVIPASATDLTGAEDIVNSGIHIVQGNVKFDESQISSHCIFKSSTNKLRSSFATKDFKSKYDENHFTGLVFKELGS
ncbi:MAG: hypothetical protein ACJAWS_002649 [Oleiphilaceae bacterium]|jgi:hypothetical protein